jgi:alkylation response protein AidB-like acyl-CoA dehydrogenase
MSENRMILCDTAQAAFADATTQGFAPIEAAGFLSLLVPEAEGGFGGDWGDLFAILRIAGAQALDLPVGDRIIEARTGAPIDRTLGAFVRVALAAGALDAALAMSIDYTNNRQQFGKPLSKFQAVQQNLAILAAEAAAVNVAGAAAAAALDAVDAGRLDDARFEIASAKLRTNVAIGIGTGIAHQVHGAIGFTRDYALHPLTTGLMRWRSEHGHDAYWADVIAGIATAKGGASLWAEITRRGDLSRA